jgi:hypothetical protein
MTSYAAINNAISVARFLKLQTQELQIPLFFKTAASN